MNNDQKTADAFAESWNHLPDGSVYTRDQFEDWMSPITQTDAQEKSVLELGCGNASLLVHLAAWNPAILHGVDLGDSVLSAEINMKKAGYRNWKIIKADLAEFTGKDNGYDLVYCIGVIHHLKNLKKGVDALVRNTKKGGRFHGWVYAREGNGVIVYIVDPLRKVVSRLPWWLTKYFIAAPLVLPYFLYAKTINALREVSWVRRLPLYQYSLWIAKREFAFFRHVAFDQLVTPQTRYIRRSQIEAWLKSYDEIDQNSAYIIMRNGNSWKFGGRKKL